MATTKNKPKKVAHPIDALQQLQEELIHCVDISLLQYGGLLGFTSACVVSILSSESKSALTLSAFLCFIIAMFCFSTIVLGLIFVLYKGRSIHIGHVIVHEDTRTVSSAIGMLAMVVGLALYSAKLSSWYIPFVLIGAMISFRSHIKFKQKLDAQADAIKLQKRVEKF